MWDCGIENTGLKIASRAGFVSVTVFMKTILMLTLASAAIMFPLGAAEMRTWTSRQGGTLEAQFGSIRGEEVTLLRTDARDLKLKTTDLSLGDRQYLVEYCGAPGETITNGESDRVEKDLRLDTSEFRKIDERLMLGDTPSQGYELFETPHFLIATAGKVRPQATAETAERLWFGMAFHHMNFRRDWGDKRMLILLVEDRDAHTGLGAWYAGHIAASGQQDAAARVRSTWDQAGSTGIHLDEETIKNHNLHPSAQVFNVKDDSRFRRGLSPFVIHTISGRLLTHQMGGVSSFGDQGYFAITTGHAYFKEISLGGKSETQLLSVEGTGGDEISSKRGFEDGSSWARTLRPLVRTGKVTAKLEPMLQWKSENLTPERLVLIYSFAYYMQSDMKRLAAYANMIRRIESSNQIPPPIEIARIFGFETVEELEKDWVEFITGRDFR